ncbi:MAG: hypothetical protein WBY24_04805 [Candidatus Acidiferrales bacterium]
MNTGATSFGRISFGKLGRGLLSFALHQYIGTLGIVVLAGFLVAYVFDVLRLFGKHIPSHIMFWILTGTPYYPVQIALGLLLGWSIGRRVQRRAMLWVWILPLAYLTYAIIAIPTLVPRLIPPEYQAGVGESRFKHYFGWGCGDVHPCFDQNAFTVVFYVAAAYSIGASLARKVSRRLPSNSPAEIWKSLALAFVFLFVTALEIVLTVRQGWKSNYLPLVMTPAGISAFMMLYAFMLHRQAPRSNNVC